MKILLADDDQALRSVLKFKLKKSGHDVTAVEDGLQAMRMLEKEQWDLLLSDIKMPNMDGIALLEEAGRLQPRLKVILLTAYATVSQAVKAVKLGAFDYITKPFEDDELTAAIDKVAAFRKLEIENEHLKGQLSEHDKLPTLLGVSRPFKDMMLVVDRIAATDATVLLTGPSGTGKELVARAIHTRSGRAHAKFVAVNCGAIPSELIESELFGHVKGSFTGAIKDKKGKFEIADGGTILLDEISELITEQQVKLLRVLQERVVEPVGSEVIRPIDVRVICATNADLRKRVATGRFREDLFYRLNVIPIEIPTLAERSDDIPVLVREFVSRCAPDASVTISKELNERLAEHTWPGNIRELENIVERMAILRTSDALDVTDLPPGFGTLVEGDDTSLLESTHVTFHEAEEKLIREALDKCGWNRTKAARYLNIPRHVLLYRLKKYSIEEGRSSRRG